MLRFVPSGLCRIPLEHLLSIYINVEKFLRNYIIEFHGFIGRVYTALPRTT